MTPKIKRISGPMLGLLLATASVSAPSFAEMHTRSVTRDGEFHVRAGAFRPEGDSDYWRGINEDFTNSDVKDFQDPSLGLDYLLPLSSYLSLDFGASFYQGRTTGSYRAFVDNRGDRIRHDTRLDIDSATIGLVVHLAGPDAPVRPYLGAGGGAYPWRLEERGDFIDFNVPSTPVFRDRLKSDGVAFGGYALAGLDVPISRNLSIFGEGRWTKVDDDLDQDFEGFGSIDLSGREVAVGLNWKF